jgi:hypothetical protein
MFTPFAIGPLNRWMKKGIGGIVKKCAGDYSIWDFEVNLSTNFK